MEQLTLNQAAEKHAPKNGLASLSDRQYMGYRQLDFKAGAEWQKEQLVNKFKNKLDGVTDQSCRIIMQAIINELLQD